MIPGTMVETADMPRYDQQARYDQQERYDQQTRSAINPTNNPAQGAAPIYVDPTGYVVRASSSINQTNPVTLVSHSSKNHHISMTLPG